MSNLTLNEKKAFYVLAIVFVLFILEYTLFDLRLISSTLEDFISVLILGSAAIYIYAQPRAKQKTKERFVGYFLVWLLTAAVIYLIIYFGCGFLFGFGKNPYDRSVSGILSNVLVFGGLIILKEWIRNFVINKADKKTLIFYGTAIVLLFTAIEVNLLDLITARSIEEFVIELCAKVLPVLALNAFMTYVCYVAGFFPAVVYMLVINVPIWFFDNLPNLEWIVVAVLGVAFPLIAIIALMETTNYNVKKNTKRKSEPKTINVLVWIVVGAFCITTAFFTAGLFSTYPTVLVSGSMTPSINRGDVVIIKKVESDDEIYINDVILYDAGSYDVVHRVVNIYYDNGVKKYITKGDDNEMADKISVELQNIGGVVIAKIPYIGLPRLILESAEYTDAVNGS